MNVSGKKGKVVLFFPAYSSGEACPPLALAAIAGPIITRGYEVVIVDSAVAEDYVSEVMQHVPGALCVGMSIVTGPMIKGAIEVGRLIKDRYPEIPIILGGWHPSILPKQTIEADFVDAIVLRQGEEAFVEIVERLSSGDDLIGVPGTLVKAGGDVITNPPRPYTPVAELPGRLPGFELFDYEHYYRKTKLRWLMYTTSHGCPFNCSYCSNASVYGRNLDFLPAEQVIDEVSYLVRKYNIKLLGIIDDIFFAFRKRSLEIAEGFIRSGLKFDWYIQDRADSWARIGKEEARTLKRSGLARIHFGAESGSDEVLTSIEKRSDVQSTLEAVEMCRHADIRASFGFIFGLPAETEEDKWATIELIIKIQELYERADCYTNIFTPYPGSPAWPESIAKGLVPPEKMEDWINFYPRLTKLPWLSEAEHRALQELRQYLRFAYPQIRAGERAHSRMYDAVMACLKPSARIRLKSRMMRFPVELYGFEALVKMRSGRDLYQRY